MKPRSGLASFAILSLAHVAVAQASLTERYAERADRIVDAALADTGGWEKLVHLCTRIGHRLSGSEQLEEAIDWAVETMQAEGLDVRRQKVKVPHWVRGREHAEVVLPRPRSIAMLGLGGSIGTPRDGIEAPVVVARSFDELESLGRDRVAGKIVVFAVDWQGYAATVAYRSNGASRAAALGAVGVLVRSATGRSLYTPHTGALRYAEGQPRIPAAAITPEDAEWFARCEDAGVPLRARLYMEARMLPDALSHNVIAEIPGSERPAEIVVMGGHYDSWDVGQGAHDDGAACIAAWHALTILRGLGLRPRRTLRVVLWTNEENGLAGGEAYALGNRVASHVAAIEMDGGCERPIGFGFTLPGSNTGSSDGAYTRARGMLEEIGALLQPIDADQILDGGGGADISPLARGGVPALALRTVSQHYFDWHHTQADTLDKVDPQDLRKAVALLGVMGYVLADMPETLRAR